MTSLILARGYLILGGALMVIGVFGFLTRQQAIAVVMCLELVANGVNLMLVAVSRLLGLGGGTGEILVLLVLVVAAAETGVALALILLLHRCDGHTELPRLFHLRW